MRRRVVESSGPRREPPRPPPPGEKVVVPHDPVNEVAVVAAALADEELLDRLLRRVLPDHFLAREAREAWAALGEARRRGLRADRATIATLASDDVVSFLAEAAKGGAPRNVEWHVSNLLWDAARATAARGPVPAFLEALRDPRAEPERVRALARQVATSFEGHEDRKYLHEPTALVRDQMLEVENRVAGRAVFPYGIPGLDYYDPGVTGRGTRRRMIPGTAPGQITLFTAVSGGGKSTAAANAALGIAFPDGVESDAPGRKVLYGAWEMKGGMTLELISCISLGWSRSDLLEGVGPVATHEGRTRLMERMKRVAERIKFLGMPFRRRVGEKATNERNLDLLQGYIADSGCDVVIADLWKRALRDVRPDEEEDALIRQQAMVEDLRVHAILLQQQRMKDVEAREDKRPTREGIKGSGAWVEIPDTIVGVHRPALWKRMNDDRIEFLVLKQRYGKFPLAIELDWDPDRGLISGGRPVEYDRPGEASELDSDFLRSGPGRRRK